MLNSPTSILKCIGNTSLLELQKVRPANGSRVLLKLESENPTGSIKDRMALAMIEAAEAKGRLGKDGFVVEYTGGSTGVSLALVCAVKNYPLHIVTSVLGSCSTVVAVESGWLDKIRSCRLYGYHLPTETFECIDDCAGYFVSREPVVPTQVDIFEDVLSELVKRDVELRFLPTLWELRNDVVDSTLQFSLIRMRNAKPKINNL